MSRIKEMLDLIIPQAVANATQSLRDDIEAKLDAWEIQAKETANPFDDILVKMLQMWLKR